MTRISTVIGVAGLVLAIPLVLAWFFQRSLIYYPEVGDPGPAAERFTHGSDVELHTRDGLTLNAWRTDPASSNGRAVLYLPGNAGNRSGRIEVAQAIADRGFTVLLLDYRGFGGNPGSPSEEGLIADAESAVNYLHDEGFQSDATIYVGESIGTGVATALAVLEPPAGLLLRSPYTSLDDVARAAFGVPLGWLMRDHFDTLSKITQVQSPVVVLAGASDDLIPPAQCRQVAENAPNLHHLVVVPNTGHNDHLWFGSFIADHVDSLASSG